MIGMCTQSKYRGEIYLTYLLYQDWEVMCKYVNGFIYTNDDVILVKKKI